MKKLYLIATIVIILALALPATVSALPRDVIQTGNIEGCPKSVALDVTYQNTMAWSWPWVSQDNERAHAVVLAVTPNSCTFDGYLLTVRDTESDKPGPTSYPGYFGQYKTSDGTWVLPSEGGKTLWNPLRVYNVSVDPGTLLPVYNGGSVSGSALALFNPLTTLNPGSAESTNLNLIQPITTTYDLPVPSGYTYRIVLTFTASPN